MSLWLLMSCYCDYWCHVTVSTVYHTDHCTNCAVLKCPGYIVTSVGLLCMSNHHISLWHRLTVVSSPTWLWLSSSDHLTPLRLPNYWLTSTDVVACISGFSLKVGKLIYYWYVFNWPIVELILLGSLSAGLPPSLADTSYLWGDEVGVSAIVWDQRWD